MYVKKLNNANRETKKGRNRSPSYTVISLEEALALTRVMYESEGLNPTRSSDILKLWEYKPKSSGGLMKLATLPKYGLVEGEGSGKDRHYRVTRAGYLLSVEGIDDATRLKLIQEAALKPRLNKILWERYSPKLPSDQNISTTLITNHNLSALNRRPSCIPQLL